MTLSLGNANLEGGCENNLSLIADILKMLKAPVAVDFARLSSVTDFHNATIIADNYKNMFAVLEPVWHHY